MGEPEPYDPENKPDPNAPPPNIERASWLVGTEDGLQTELDAAAKRARLLAAAPRLTRPEDPDAGASPEKPRAETPFPSRAPMPPNPPSGRVPPAPSPKLPAWDSGSNSVPMLRRSAPAGGPALSPIPELTRDFPMDDAEERARISAQAAEQQTRDAAIAARPHLVVAPQEFEIPVPPLPLWVQVPSLIRSDRRVQAVVVGALLFLLVVACWPRGEQTIAVAHLKQQPARYADTQVRVKGRVAEVFNVGGSWAYTLVQGRDTIVVFSRTRGPRVQDKVVVVGTLSSGYLDGQSRIAIFENTR